MDWDRGQVTSLNLQNDDEINQSNQSHTRYSIQNRFREFIRHFRMGNVFYYREELISNYRKKIWCLPIHLQHLNSYDNELQDLLFKNPTEYLPLFENATKDALKQLISSSREGSADPQPSIEKLPDIQIILKSNQIPVALRQMHTQDINKLVKIPGIVISASKVRAKSISMTLKCRNCLSLKVVPCTSAFGGAQIPRKCDRVTSAEMGEQECPKDSYIILPDRCSYVDQQTLKLQENPEAVPTGEMPRNILLATDRYLVDRVAPGTRVAIIGISSVFNSGAKQQVGAVAIRTPYLRVVGIEIDEEGAGRAKNSFTPKEEERFQELARDPLIYEKIAKSFAPTNYDDYTVDIKKAIACLLFGGSRKQLPDGMMLRGDINVLLLGDPSAGKSQFLKFTEKVAPIGVYTSGKGSSAAGLTASVIRDSKGEFYLEGGAMVLADGGVVCIDEFDKMRESDRVAIHEAMEQQTISIAKAGITTILNSRTSVLAAANPVFGRYDDMRSASENIDLMSTILSRFDLIFIVRDIQDDERDKSLAAHIVRIHTNALGGGEASNERQGEISPKLLKKFVTYCRNRCGPRLSRDAIQTLQDFYVNIRDDFRQNNPNSVQAAIPVTVRQLEALVRLSEALAKMRLCSEANVEHVNEAIRLFQVSTMSAAKEGGCAELLNNYNEQAELVEENINRLLVVGNKIETHGLYIKLEAQGFHPNYIQKVIRGMVQRGSLKQLNQYRFIQRVK